MSESTALLREDDALQGMRQRLRDGVRENAPDYRQIVLLAGIAIAVAIGIWLFVWSQQPGYAPLYSGLSEKDSGEVVDALRAAEIPFRLDAATGAITVPEERIHETRLQLATQGLPQGTPRAGIEMIEGEQGFGVSQFIEGVRYQHALETELARTIATMRPVRSARVHLALPKQTAFTRSREAAGASVVLELHPGRTLERNQVAAIVHTVASSIPGMKPESVTLVDQTGHMLTDPDPDSEDAVNNRQFEQVRRLEASYADRIRELLEPVAGAGRTSVQVHIDMDFSVVEEAREIFNNDPVNARVRNEQTAESSSAELLPIGIPGATSNAPPGPASAAAQNAGNNSRSATRNYELDRTLTHTRQATGRIRRVSAAVIVDNIAQTNAKGAISYRPLTADELKRTEKLVGEAIGFDAQRGDSFSVVNAAFVRSAAAPADAGESLWAFVEDTPPLAKDAARLLLGAVVVLAIVFGLLRPAIRQLLPPPAPAAAGETESAATARLLEAAAANASAQAHGQQHSLPGPDATDDAFQRARSAVGEDPRRVAQVVKNWIASNG